MSSSSEVLSPNEALFRQAESAIECLIEDHFAVPPLQAVNIPGLRRLREETTTQQSQIQLMVDAERLARAARRLNDASASLLLSHARRHNSIQPVAILPVEVLCVVFEHLARSDWSDTDWRGPGNIARVCSQWRTIALRCKVVWRDAHLQWSPLLLDLWASRCHDDPLNLRVAISPRYHFGYRPEEPYPSDGHLCRQQKHFSNMHSLSVTFNGPRSEADVIRTLKIFGDLSHPHLRSLSVIVENFSSRFITHPKIPGVFDFFRLQSLKLVSVRLDPLSFVSPYLVELFLSDVQVVSHSICFLLLLCGSLQRLTLEKVRDSEDPSWPTSSKKFEIFDCLENLKLNDVSGRLYDFFAKHLHLSQLRGLHIVSLEHEQLASRIVRKAQNLTSLSFTVQETEPKQLMLDALSEHQHLQYLTIPCTPENGGRDEDVLEGFTTKQLEKPNRLVLDGKSLALRELKAPGMEKKREAWFSERVKYLST